MNTVLQWIDRNWPAVVGVLLASGVLLAVYGCSSKVDSPVTGQKVTAEGLDADVQGWQAKYAAELRSNQDEWGTQIDALQKKIAGANDLAAADVEAMQAKVNAAQAELARQDQFKQMIVTVAGQALQGVGGPIPAAIASIIAAGGFLVNGRRKDIIITALKGQRDAALAGSRTVPTPLIT